jgi:hypothetical protein
VLAAAAKNGLAVNIQGPTRLDQIAQLAARNPNTQMDIDHLGLYAAAEAAAGRAVGQLTEGAGGNPDLWGLNYRPQRPHKEPALVSKAA